MQQKQRRKNISFDSCNRLTSLALSDTIKKNNIVGVPERAEIIPFEHDEVILGMETLLYFHLPRIREVFL